MRTFFFLSIFSFLIFSCGESVNSSSADDSAAGTQQADSTETTSTDLKEIEVLSIISDLNVRSTPGKEGVVIDKLSFDQRAIWYGEETDYKEKIIMRDIPRFSSWKKVRFSGSGGKGALDGWVYGGGIVLKDEAYVQKNDSLVIRDFDAVTEQEIESLTDIEADFGKYSKGRISYLKDFKSGSLIKNGSFQFEDWENKILSSEKDFGTKLIGTFVKGKLEGELTKKSKSGALDYTCFLTYRSGVCQKASISGVYYGQKIDYNTEKPSECSILFLEDMLQE